jgi:hypothetical protein
MRLQHFVIAPAKSSHRMRPAAASGPTGSLRLAKSDAGSANAAVIVSIGHPWSHVPANSPFAGSGRQHD